jgi:hypothetical protein
MSDCEDLGPLYLLLAKADISNEIASGLSRVFMMPPPHGEQQQRK